MQTLKIACLGLMVFMLNTGCSSKSVNGNVNNSEKNTEKVSVYYFHFNVRCVACRAVEAQTQADVKELFGNKVSFHAYNLDEDQGIAMGKKLGVYGQMLLIVKGDKKINLTNEGFMYAKVNPAKFKKILNNNIKPLL